MVIICFLQILPVAGNEACFFNFFSLPYTEMYYIYNWRDVIDYIP